MLWSFAFCHSCTVLSRATSRDDLRSLTWTFCPHADADSDSHQEIHYLLASFFFFNLMLSPLFLSDTLTHSVRNTACLYTAVACADADTSVLSSYYLRCAQRTGVLSPSFHSAGRGWSRDTHSAGAVSVSHEKKLEECFVNLPIASLCSLDVPELFMGNLTPMRNLSAC